MSEWSTEERLVEEAVAAIGEGRAVVLPTDTVYGLCTTPLAPESLVRLKGRGADQPIALLASEVDILLELVPELPVIVDYIARVTARPSFARAAKIDADLLAARGP